MHNERSPVASRTRRVLLGLALLLAVLTALAAPAAAQRKAATPKRLVVIDAGHGGVDPGASGPSGAREKDVTLSVARKLAALLREDPTLEVRMTRDRDTLIALRDRPRMANRWRTASGVKDRPALFLSIHANSHRSTSARGFETFFLSEAKTEDARRVAEMENAAEEYETESDGSGDALGFILNDLRQNLYLRESSDWAAEIQRRLAVVHPGPDRGVKQAGFVVLNGAFMPAVLVELGFITNEADAKLLVADAHQREMARQLAGAVRGFFEEGSLTARAAGS